MAQHNRKQGRKPTTWTWLMAQRSVFPTAATSSSGLNRIYLASYLEKQTMVMAAALLIFQNQKNVRQHLAGVRG
jgi:hypothetical protein